MNYANLEECIILSVSNEILFFSAENYLGMCFGNTLRKYVAGALNFQILPIVHDFIRNQKAMKVNNFRANKIIHSRTDELYLYKTNFALILTQK